MDESGRIILSALELLMSRSCQRATFSNANALPRLAKTFFRATEFIEQKCKLQSKRDWFGMNAMAAPNHWGHFEPARLIGNGCAQCFKVFEDDRRRLRQLHRQGCI